MTLNDWKEKLAEYVNGVLNNYTELFAHLEELENIEEKKHFRRRR